MAGRRQCAHWPGSHSARHWASVSFLRVTPRALCPRACELVSRAPSSTSTIGGAGRRCPADGVPTAQGHVGEALQLSSAAGGSGGLSESSRNPLQHHRGSRSAAPQSEGVGCPPERASSGRGSGCGTTAARVPCRQDRHHHSLTAPRPSRAFLSLQGL